MKKLLAVFLCLGIAGCATFNYSQTQELQVKTSGFVGCAPSDIKISNVLLVNPHSDFPISWEAQCNNKRYFCSQPDKYTNISCSEAK